MTRTVNERVEMLLLPTLKLFMYLFLLNTIMSKEQRSLTCEWYLCLYFSAHKPYFCFPSGGLQGSHRNVICHKKIIQCMRAIVSFTLLAVHSSLYTVQARCFPKMLVGDQKHSPISALPLSHAVPSGFPRCSQ